MNLSAELGKVESMEIVVAIFVILLVVVVVCALLQGGSKTGETPSEKLRKSQLNKGDQEAVDEILKRADEYHLKSEESDD